MPCFTPLRCCVGGAHISVPYWRKQPLTRHNTPTQTTHSQSLLAQTWRCVVCHDAVSHCHSTVRCCWTNTNAQIHSSSSSSSSSCKYHTTFSNLTINMPCFTPLRCCVGGTHISVSYWRKHPLTRHNKPTQTTHSQSLLAQTCCVVCHGAVSQHHSSVRCWTTTNAQIHSSSSSILSCKYHTAHSKKIEQLILVIQLYTYLMYLNIPIQLTSHAKQVPALSALALLLCISQLVTVKAVRAVTLAPLINTDRPPPLPALALIESAHNRSRYHDHKYSHKHHRQYLLEAMQHYWTVDNYLV